MIDDQIKKNAIVVEHRKTLIETIKEHLPNPAEIIIDQIIQMFIQWYNRILISSLIMIIIPIYMISIGVHFHSFMSKIILSSITYDYLWDSIINSCYSTYLYINYMEEKPEIDIIINLSTNTIFEIIFLSICLIGLIILTIVLVKISNTNSIHQTSDYCHPILYYSSYILRFSSL